MGEYVKYKGTEVKIGTLENLYYVTYPKFKEAFENGLLRQSEFSVHPAKCLEPNSGFLFRFPFPDEDKLTFGRIADHRFDRGVPIKMVPEKDIELMQLMEMSKGRQVTLNLIQQKLVLRKSDGMSIMASVFRESVSGTTFRIEGEQSIKKVVGQIVRNHLQKTTEDQERQLYLGIASRILKGYGLNPDLVINGQIGKVVKIAKRSKRQDNGLGYGL